MDIQDILNLLAEFDGNNHRALANKYRLSLRAVYEIIKNARKAAAHPAAHYLSTFSLLLGRLTELLGAEIATKLVRDFQGATVQFPITSHYTASSGSADSYNEFGFSNQATVIGDGFDQIVDQYIKESTRSNGKQLISRSEAETRVRNLIVDTAPSAPPAVQAIQVPQKVRHLAQQDHNAQQQLSSAQPELPLAPDCPECTRLKDRAVQQKAHLPNRPSGLLQFLMLRFRRGRSG